LNPQPASKFSTLVGQICKFNDFGQNFCVFLTDPQDYIQQFWLRGELYEREELEVIRGIAPAGAVCLDIGSNVGNHAIFMAKVMHASKVYCFEALSVCSELIQINGLLNQCSEILDCSYLGLALGAEVEIARAIIPQGNIGATRFASDRQLDVTSVPVLPLDCLNINEKIDFVKIDIEGAELAVMDGMKQLIERCRPLIFVEVNNENLSGFEKMLEILSYQVAYRNKRYAENENFLIVPTSA